MVVGRYADNAVSMAKRGISIVIPLHNESALLKRDIPDFLRWLSMFKGNREVVIVENGSTDDSKKQLSRLVAQYPDMLRVFHLPAATFGGAVRGGILQARFSCIVLLNADWLDRDFLVTARAMIDNNQADMVVGSKGMAESQDKRPLMRRLLTLGLIFALRALLGYRGKSINGLKAFRASSVQPLVRICRTSEIIESELILRAARAGLTVVEVPVVLVELRPPRISVARRALKVAHELRLLRQILRYRTLRPKLHIDDGGYNNRAVNAAEALIQLDRVESISVMAGMPATKRLAQFLLSLPTDKRPRLFLHFNVVEAKALSPKIRQTSLTDERGCFLGMRHVVEAALRGRLPVAAVRQELEAQLADVEALGLAIEGIDSHQHMHGLAPIATAVEELAGRRGLMVRDFHGFTAVTLRGRAKLWALRQVARLSQFRLNGRWRLPDSWRSKKAWQPFVMCSWEAVGAHNVPEKAIIVCHPLLGYDVYEIE
jgi:glycosyltransferase involved in cell wall biosynthesis